MQSEIPIGAGSVDRAAYFDRIYATDLRYVPDCYKLCGDAHCCNFTRYKSHFGFMGKNGAHELPLLPTEFEYLSARGRLGQFGDYELKTFEFPIRQGLIRYNAILSKRPGCVCDNATRTTICRLYPLYPQFNASGGVVGMEDIGIYEELERIGGLPRACQIDRIPLGEMKGFIALAAHLGSDPYIAFHMEAFRLAKAAAARAVETAFAASGKNVFRSFEMLMLRGKVFDVEKLRTDLEQLADRFEAVHGSRFRL